MINDERKRWLRGAYQDRIFEVAINFAAGRTYFVDADWETYIGTEFGYLPELSPDDHMYLREQAGLEAWKRIRDNNVAERRAAYDAMCTEYPDIIVRDAEFAFDIGWVDLVKDAATRIRTYPSAWKTRLDGGKEKFGCLVLFVSFDIQERGAVSEVERMREEARLRSLATCEICRNQGRLRISSIAKTVCDEHVAVLGELRDDDGLWSDPWKWMIPTEQPTEPSGYDEPSSIELLRDLEPPVQRPTDHEEYAPDPMRATALGQRIDDDIWRHSGREQELLIEFGYYIQDAVKGACVKEEYLSRYIDDELNGWGTYARVPLSDNARKFLHGYVRRLIDEEYERIKAKQEAERGKD